MFSDPQSVTVNAVAQSLPRTGATLNQGRFAKSDGSYVLSASHSTGRRTQHRIRLDGSKIVTDPLTSDRNIPVSASVYLVVDRPITGYTNDEVVQLVAALTSWLSAGTNANAIKLVGSEI